MEGKNLYKGKGALDAFLNLLSLITLCWFSISLGGLLFQIINKFFSADKAVFSQMILRNNIASLIIILPIFLAVVNILHQQYKKDNLNHASGVYRWLTYLMLLVSALNIIGSLVALLNSFLNGDYALVIVLKILTVLFIASGIFGYYFYDLKRKDYSSRSPVSVGAFSAVVVICLMAIVLGFFLIDSPRVARSKKFDSQRVERISNIYLILTSAQLIGKPLPENLSGDQYVALVDPETKKPFSYKVNSDKEFEICADFNLPADESQTQVPGGFEWIYHKAGHQCFNVSIDTANLQKLMQTQNMGAQGAVQIPANATPASMQ